MPALLRLNDQFTIYANTLSRTPLRSSDLALRPDPPRRFKIQPKALYSSGGPNARLHGGIP